MRGRACGGSGRCGGGECVGRVDAGDAGEFEEAWSVAPVCGPAVVSIVPIGGVVGAIVEPEAVFAREAGEVVEDRRDAGEGALAGGELVFPEEVEGVLLEVVDGVLGVLVEHGVLVGEDEGAVFDLDEPAVVDVTEELVGVGVSGDAAGALGGACGCGDVSGFGDALDLGGDGEGVVEVFEGAHAEREVELLVVEGPGEVVEVAGGPCVGGEALVFAGAAGECDGADHVVVRSAVDDVCGAEPGEASAADVEDGGVGGEAIKDELGDGVVDHGVLGLAG